MGGAQNCVCVCTRTKCTRKLVHVSMDAYMVHLSEQRTTQVLVGPVLPYLDRVSRSPTDMPGKVAQELAGTFLSAPLALLLIARLTDTCRHVQLCIDSGGPDLLLVLGQQILPLDPPHSQVPNTCVYFLNLTKMAR